MATRIATGSAIEPPASAAADQAQMHDAGSASLVIAVRSARRLLAFCVCALVIAGISSVVLKFGFGYSKAFGFMHLLVLYGERNVTTWFSLFLLLSIGVLLFVIAAIKIKSADHWRFYWVGLSIIFFYLSLDEYIQIHERVSTRVQEYLQTTGPFLYAWVIPASILLLGFAAIYARFTFALPLKTRNWFVLSAIIYVGGALGVEMIGSAQASAHGTGNLAYVLIASLEETLEMTGLVVFILTLIDYMRSQWGELRLSFGP